MTYVRPEFPDGVKGSVKDDCADFWVEGVTAGTVLGKAYMDGERLKGVVSVTTEQEVHKATTVTITFIARTLNKGERPE